LPDLYQTTNIPGKYPLGRTEWNKKHDLGFTDWLEWNMSTSMGKLLEEINM